MFVINEDLSIYITRGDACEISVGAKKEDGTAYIFSAGEVVRLKVVEKKDCESVMMQKDVVVEQDTDVVAMGLTEADTKFGDVISKPTDFWYEVELNPDTEPQTIIGYDEDGPKIFRLYPEGDDFEQEEIRPEEIPVVDGELDMASERPVANKVISRAISYLKEVIQDVKEVLVDRMNTFDQRLDGYVAPDMSPYATTAQLQAHVGTMFTFLLEAKATVYRLEDAAIKEDTMVDIYTDVYGVCPVDVKSGVGYLEFTFEPQEKDVNVKVRCF